MTATSGGGITRTVAVVGGGLGGSLFALKLARARPDFRILVIEASNRLGRGVAYGACAPYHLLNVPVSRMEVGLDPGFGDWLGATDHAQAAMIPALAESGGDAQGAFVPRALFGDYLRERLGDALVIGDGAGVAAVRGEVVGISAGSRLALRLADGRGVPADTVVLAMGNMPPRAPGGPGGWLYDSPWFIPDPWASDAFEGVDEDAPLLLLGAGLTTVDIALRLRERGHRGRMLALSRRGLTPEVHSAGGSWPAFMEAALPASPLALTRLLRAQVELARAKGVPWQRVFDAARPAVPAVWRSWTHRQKRQFIRHLRTRWDVRRHRMAPRIAAAFSQMVDAGALRIDSGRVMDHRPLGPPGRSLVEIVYGRRGGETRRFAAAHVINCTGPRRDLGASGVPLIASLREQGLATPDSLGLGLETDGAALMDRFGLPSSRLFALGALTCPSWWEITAVPEIAVQIDRLVARLAGADGRGPATHPLAAEDFLDLGAGI